MSLQYRISINNFTYRRYSFEYFLQSAKRLGIGKIELSGCHPHFTQYEAECFDTAALASRIEAAGLTVSVVDPEQNFLPINIASSQEYLWEQSVETLEWYVRNTPAFGCDKIIIYPGKGAMDQAFDEARDNAVCALKRLCRVAAECGVKVLLQNVSACISNLTTTLEDFSTMYDMVDDENLYVSINTCPLRAAGETLAQYFNAFGSRILNIQLADSCEDDEQMGIGEGDQDFKQHLLDLRNHGYTGDIALEITEEEYADDAENYYRDSIDAILSIAKEV